MKLATLKEGGRDGTLVVVDRELQHYVAVPEIAPTLQDAVGRWDEAEGLLREVKTV
jgi:fumarylacetoacetate (FAA) hydrolase